MRTNELLENITEIILFIQSGVNTSQLSFTGPATFEPQGSDIRLNCYWTISLVFSVRLPIHLRNMKQ